MNNDKDCGVMYDQGGKHVGAFFVVPDSCRVDLVKIDETKDRLVAMRFNGDFDAKALGDKMVAAGNLLLRQKGEQ